MRDQSLEHEPMQYTEAEFSQIKTVPVELRPNKVRAEDFASPPPSDGAARSMHAFLSSLPDILVARDFLAVVDAIVKARQSQKGVLLMLGGHVVKTGLAKVIVDMVAQGVVTHVAMNGSAAIHDYEIARFGGTSEDVAVGLRDGTFGMAEETGRGLNEAFAAGMANGWGMGESVARDLATPRAAHAPRSVAHLSVLASWRSCNHTRRTWRGNNSSASVGGRRRDRRHQPPGFSPACRFADHFT